jgi:hypothetical protein
MTESINISSLYKSIVVNKEYDLYTEFSINDIPLLETLLKSLENNVFDVFIKINSPICIVHSKKLNTVYLYSNHFNNRQLFYSISPNKIILSDRYYDIIREEHSIIEYESICSNLIFNYGLNSSTLNTGIKSLSPGSIIKIQNGVLYDFSQKYKSHSLSQQMEPSDILSNYILNNIKENNPVLLSMTGGFDSRVNFAILLKLGIKFEAFTFGNPNSNDAVPAINLCNQYGIKHHLIDLNNDFYQHREKYVDRLIESSLNNPFVLDLAHYEFVKELFPASNIVTGYMGGEILTGGNVGSSQVTFTQTAKDLLTSENLLEFKNKFLSNFDTQFIRLDNIPDLDEYLNSFSNYFYKKKTNNQNLTNFLLYEKYHKFFGVIKSIYSPKHHQIDTFMAPEYFNYIHQLPYNYNNTPLFKRNPYTNYLSRRFYAQIIKETTPSLLESKLDRGYKVKDLLSPFGLLNISKNYYLNHTGRGNKLNIKTIDYRKWFEADVFEYLKHSSNLQDYFNKDFVFKVIDEYYVDKQAYPISVFNKLMVIYGLMKAIDLIKKKSANNNAIN